MHSSGSNWSGTDHDRAIMAKENTKGISPLDSSLGRLLHAILIRVLVFPRYTYLPKALLIFSHRFSHIQGNAAVQLDSLIDSTSPRPLLPRDVGIPPWSW